MLMVIFGAGASYDSSVRRPTPEKPFIEEPPDREKHRPPLAAELFGERGIFRDALLKFPQCKAIIPLFNRLPSNKSVEQLLEQLRAEAESDHRKYIQLAAVKHYLQTIIHTCEVSWSNENAGITNYLTVLNEIEAWRAVRGESICLVTFNYDRLIERALQDLGIHIATLDDYIRQQYILIKLHGSVNWGREVHVLPNTLDTRTTHTITYKEYS